MVNHVAAGGKLRGGNYGITDRFPLGFHRPRIEASGKGRSQPVAALYSESVQKP